MKKILVLAIGLILLSLAWFNYQNSPRTILARLNMEKLESSLTQLHYKIYLLGIFPVGTAILEDAGLVKDDGREMYRLNAKAEGEGIVGRIYPFHVDIHSYLEPRTMLPLIFRQQIKTSDKEIAKEARYNQKDHIMEISGERRQIEPETFEPLSAIYKLRGLELEKLADFNLNINTNQKNYAFTGSINKQEQVIRNRKEKLYVLKGRIFRRDKNPYHQSQVEVILFGDQDKVPILIKVFASGMLITARLTNL